MPGRRFLKHALLATLLILGAKVYGEINPGSIRKQSEIENVVSTQKLSCHEPNNTMIHGKEIILQNLQDACQESFSNHDNPTTYSAGIPSTSNVANGIQESNYIDDEQDDEDEDECESPADQPDPCQYVRDNCQDISSTVNYLELYYCHLDGSVPLPITMIVLILYLVVLFYVLGTTGDRYFCRSLVSISRAFRMPHDVTAITFYALGSGSTDLFAVLASLSVDDIDIALGGLLGAGNFAVCLVFGVVIVLSSPLAVQPRLFSRDIAFYWIALVAIFFVCLDGKISIYEPLALIGFYGVYVFLAFWRVRRQEAYKKLGYEALPNDSSNHESSKIVGDASDDPQIKTGEQGELVDDLNEKLPIAQPHSIPVRAFQPVTRSSEHSTVSTNIIAAHIANRQAAVLTVPDMEPESDSDEDLLDASSTQQIQSPGGKGSAQDDSSFPTTNNGATDDSDSEWSLSDLSEMRWYMKPVLLVVLFLNFIRDISIPPCERADWSHKRAFVSPFFSSILLVYTAYRQNTFSAQIGGGGFLAIYFAIIVSLPVCCFIYFTTNNSGPPKNKIYRSVFVLSSFAMSVVWTYHSATAVVSVLQALGLAVGVSSEILGITVLAWGNTIGDLVAGIALAKQNKPQIVVTACFAAPLFNITVGFGINLIIATIDGSLDFDIPTNNILAFSTLMGILPVILLAFYLREWQSSRIFGYFLISYYFIFLGFSILIESSVIS